MIPIPSLDYISCVNTQFIPEGSYKLCATQGTLEEAERQLGSVRQEVDGVKRQQLLLRGKLIDQRQQQHSQQQQSQQQQLIDQRQQSNQKSQQQLVRPGVRRQLETATAEELPPPPPGSSRAAALAESVARRIIINAAAAASSKERQPQQTPSGCSGKVVVFKDARGAVVSEMLSVRPAVAAPEDDDDDANGRRRRLHYERQRDSCHSDDALGMATGSLDRSDTQHVADNAGSGIKDVLRRLERL